jgi:hypothetical protein
METREKLITTKDTKVHEGNLTKATSTGVLLTR